MEPMTDNYVQAWRSSNTWIPISPVPRAIVLSLRNVKDLILLMLVKVGTRSTDQIRFLNFALHHDERSYICGY